MDSDNGQKVPLIERLGRVPATARVIEQTPNPLGFDVASFPVGALCREAAARINELEADLEHERIRLAACGVVAGANTRDSAAKVRQMSPEYRSASLDDVERAVDREIAERERLEAAEALLTEARFYMSGHYDFIKPNTGLLELMRRVDAYFGDRALPD